MSYRSIRVGAYPIYRDNPWQDIIYSGLPDVGAVVFELPDLDQALSRADLDVLHVNWTGHWTQSAPDAATAAVRVSRAIAAIQRFKRDGGRVIWTVHNVLPHETHFLGAEVVLCRSLSRLADVITIINPDTPDLVSDWYTLPVEKLVVLDFPSYSGRYRDEISRSEARTALEIDHEECVFLLLGLLRPYKGIEELLSGFQTARSENDRLRLVIAGRPGHGYDPVPLQRRVDSIPGAALYLGHVEDDDIQRFMRAADAMVLPYRASLNISAVYLAATFGLPVVVSDSESTAYLRHESWVLRTPTDEHSLAQSLLRFADSGVDSKAAAVAAGVRASPLRIAQEFGSLVSALVSVPD